MFETEAFLGSANHHALLNNYASVADGATASRHQRGQALFNRTVGLSGNNPRQGKTRLISTRKTDQSARSVMPKTAINYYNLRKGLYLKNGGSRGASMSRESSKAIVTHTHDTTTKSTGILNAYGELAAD